MEEEKDGVSRGARIFAVVRTVFIYLLSFCLVFSAVLFAVNQSPQKSLYGYRYYTVLTPSMEPELSVGDLVIVKLANADEIEVGDIITFNPSSDGEAFLTHRVTQRLENYKGTGVTCFITKGDANDTEDGFVIDSSRLIGRVSFHIPKVGYVIRFVQLRWYFVLPLVVMLIVLFELLRVYFRADEEVAEETEAEETPDLPEDAT